MRPRIHSLSYWTCLSALCAWSQLAQAQEAPHEAAPEAPPIDAAPPAEEPPAEKPPAEQPSAEKPPAEQPPGSGVSSDPLPLEGSDPAPVPGPDEQADVEPPAAPVGGPAPEPAAPSKGPRSHTTVPLTQAPKWNRRAALPQDQGSVDERSADKARSGQSPWRISRLSLEQSLTTQTLGIGDDYQSRNPTYDWTLSLLPRYYFIDQDTWTYSVRATAAVAQELTDSADTTERREIDFADTLLHLRYDRTLYDSERYTTIVGLGVPELTLPTSKASRKNGRILGVGAGLIPTQVLPLATGPVLNTLAISALARYQHYFSRARVATNQEINQVRTNIGGRPVISDQLSGAPFAKHETRFGLIGELYLHDSVVLASEVQWRPTWNYEVNRSLEFCGLLTGCTQLDSVDDPQNFEVVTSFAAQIEAQLLRAMSVTLGYINLANQIGPDGQRRSLFYSPNSRFYVAVTAFLSELFDPREAPKQVVRTARGGTAPSRF